MPEAQERIDTILTHSLVMVGRKLGYISTSKPIQSVFSHIQLRKLHYHQYQRYTTLKVRFIFIPIFKASIPCSFVLFILIGKTVIYGWVTRMKNCPPNLNPEGESQKRSQFRQQLSECIANKGTFFHQPHLSKDLPAFQQHYNVGSRL